MRALVDTGVWFRFVRRLPQHRTIDEALGDSRTRRYLSAISVMEIVRKWRAGKLDCPDPAEWLDTALEGFEIIVIDEPIARQAALWEWELKDPADRLIAASAKLRGIELWHSDTVLRDLDGFPQRYFKAPSL